MTESEKLAHKYFIEETGKAKENILHIAYNVEKYTDEEFSRLLHVELTRYDDCRRMAEYYDKL